MKLRRVHHSGASGAGDEVTLDAAESHHLRRVLRLGPGDAVGVFDGRGKEWRGVVSTVAGGNVRVSLHEEITDPVDAPVAVTLLQALCRADRMEWVVQKGTELGVRAVRPVLTEHVDAPVPSAARLERWRRIALEACKQCGRRVVPEISPPAALPVGEPPSGCQALALDGGGGSKALRDLLGVARPREVWLAVGPEGGFSEREIEALEGAGWRRASLGPRTLRAETAGIVATALVLHAWADLGSG